MPIAKRSCATCKKLAGVFTCRGCEEDFCRIHANEHRQDLDRQIDELSIDHDQLQQNLIQHFDAKCQTLLFKQIDQWEQSSIEKIHQFADETRNEIKQICSEQETNLAERLKTLTDDIKQSREDDNFFETEIREWKTKLNELKDDLINCRAVSIQPIDDAIRIIPKLLITICNDGIFDQTTEHIQIVDNGKAIVHSHQTNNHAGARVQQEFLRGQHRFRFQIQHLNENKWIFCGIVSKSVSLINTCHNSSSSYGWSSTNQVYLNGKNQTGQKTYKSDMDLNDILEFVVDCDRQKIRLINERTQSTYELNVNLNHCPFPWKLQFNLHFFNDRIRFLAF
ncbi:unnamed protein product [Adineta ricciae]|uniref:B box-type domain-containing protein n=1 Tax=Adineta ricciae TaxID=249248 RepID=A0A815I910_ADIRI|nr:unnamed protein product [Adineta ricciae]CAF1362965.1 unnamed protein product [Adineta ricciae]